MPNDSREPAVLEHGKQSADTKVPAEAASIHLKSAEQALQATAATDLSALVGPQDREAQPLANAVVSVHVEAFVGNWVVGTVAAFAVVFPVLVEQIVVCLADAHLAASGPIVVLAALFLEVVIEQTLVELVADSVVATVQVVVAVVLVLATEQTPVEAVFLNLATEQILVEAVAFVLATERILVEAVAVFVLATGQTHALVVVLDPATEGILAEAVTVCDLATEQILVLAVAVFDLASG